MCGSLYTVLSKSQAIRRLPGPFAYTVPSSPPSILRAATTRFVGFLIGASAPTPPSPNSSWLSARPWIRHFATSILSFSMSVMVRGVCRYRGSPDNPCTSEAWPVTPFQQRTPVPQTFSQSKEDRPRSFEVHCEGPRSCASCRACRLQLTRRTRP